MARAPSTASRFQNALLYDPGRGVGRYPERSTATLPMMPITQSPPVTQSPPTAFDPGVMPPYSSAPFGPAVGAASGVPTAAAAGASLAPAAINALLKGGKYIAENGIPGTDQGFTPQVDWGGTAAGLVPADANPFGVDLFWAPDGLDLGVGSAGYYGTGGITGGAGPITAEEIANAPAFEMLPEEAAWASGAPMDSAAGTAADGAGAGFDWSSLGGSALTAIGTLGLGMAGGALGRSIHGRGDPDDMHNQQIAGAIGTVAGALVGMPGPGAFIGNLIGAQFTGEPDDPYAFSSGSIGAGANGPALTFGAGGAMNRADPAAGTRLGARLTDYINGRAAQEGYIVNPEMVNQSFGAAGYKGGPEGGFYFTEPGHAPGEANPAWSGNSFEDLQNTTYGSLLNGGFLARPGSTADWSTVQADLAGQTNPGITWMGEGAPGFVPNDPNWSPIYSQAPNMLAQQAAAASPGFTDPGGN